MGIDEVEAVRRFGERDEFGNRPVMATILARAEREKAKDEKQRRISWDMEWEDDYGVPPR